MFFCDAHGRVRLAQRPKACRLRGDERNILWVIKIWIENTPHSLQSCFYHALLDVLFEYVALIIRKSAFFFTAIQNLQICILRIHFSMVYVE